MQHLAYVSELSANGFELIKWNIQTVHAALREVWERPAGVGNGVEDRVTPGGAQAFIVCVPPNLQIPAASFLPCQGSVSAGKLTV